MSKLFHCPHCQQQVRVPDELLGMLVRCPGCGSNFTAGESPSSRRPEPPLARSRRRDEPDPYDDDDDDDRPRRRRRRGNYAEHRGSMILTFGILALVLLGPIFGPMAWIMGSNDLKEIRAGRMDPEGESQTHTGMILGMIATILSIVGLVITLCWCGFWFAFLGAVAR